MKSSRILSISILLLIASVIVLTNCKDEKLQADELPPEVFIDSITDVSLTSAVVNARVEFNVNPITQKGVCWGTTNSPTVDGPHTEEGEESGLFTSTMSPLNKGTVYYVRAYAVNVNGTSYSDPVKVQAGTATDYDGNVYDVVNIDGRKWLAENLRVTHYNNGDPIPLVNGNQEWSQQTGGAYCYVNGSAANTADYGLLYNWYAGFDPRGVCPKGFKPVAEQVYNGLAEGRSGGSGARLKSTGTEFWKEPNEGATNSSGFSGRGTGYRNADGEFLEFQEICYFWDAASLSSSAYVAWLKYSNADFVTNFTAKDKRFGLCIRCIGE